MDHFREWVAMHAGRDNAENAKNWTRDTAEKLLAQVQVDMAGGEPPEQTDNDGDRIPF